MDPIQAPPAASIPPPVSELQTPPPTPKPKLNSRLLIVIAILAGLLLSSFGVVYVLQAQQNNTIPTPVAQPSPTPTPNPTANWKSYENKKIQFSLKYPPTWIEKGPVSDTDSTFAYLFSEEKFGPEIEPLQYFIVISSENKLPNVKLTKGSLNSYTTYKTDELIGGGLYTFITQNENTYISLSLNPYDSEQTSPPQSKYVDIYNQILSTFKFTDQTSSNSAEDTKNLPKEQCGCWDGINNVCLNQSACL